MAERILQNEWSLLTEQWAGDEAAAEPEPDPSNIESSLIKQRVLEPRYDNRIVLRHRI